VGDYLRELWADTMAEWVTELIIDVLGVLIVSTFLLLIVLFLIGLSARLSPAFKIALVPIESAAAMDCCSRWQTP
jgi:hypothetical protein